MKSFIEWLHLVNECRQEEKETTHQYRMWTPKQSLLFQPFKLVPRVRVYANLKVFLSSQLLPISTMFWMIDSYWQIT